MMHVVSGTSRSIHNKPLIDDATHRPDLTQTKSIGLACWFADSLAFSLFAFTVKAQLQCIITEKHIGEKKVT